MIEPTPTLTVVRMPRQTEAETAALVARQKRNGATSAECSHALDLDDDARLALAGPDQAHES